MSKPIDDVGCRPTTGSQHQAGLLTAVTAVAAVAAVATAVATAVTTAVTTAVAVAAIPVVWASVEQFVRILHYRHLPPTQRRHRRKGFNPASVALLSETVRPESSLVQTLFVTFCELGLKQALVAAHKVFRNPIDALPFSCNEGASYSLRKVEA
jgi:hypothetical protein